MTIEITAEDASDFGAYFDIADELDQAAQHPEEGLGIEDMAPEYLDVARRVAARLDLPWPPELMPAEDFLNDHREELDQFHKTGPAQVFNEATGKWEVRDAG